jgi:phage baseplate assembly protein W
MTTPIVPTVPYWQFALGTAGEIVSGLDELSQALKILITTPKGSVPLRPDFGCDLQAHLDKPGPQAIADLIREISKAVATWEPRITLQTIKVKSITVGGGLTLAITWTPTTDTTSSTDTAQTTEVSV